MHRKTSFTDSSSEVINKYRGTVSGRWFDLINLQLQKHGVSPLPPEHFNIPLESGSYCDRPIPVDGARRLLYWAVEQTDEPLLPVDLGLSLQPLDFKSLGIVLWSSASLRQRIEKLETYQSLITTTTRIIFNETAGTASLLLIDNDAVDKQVNLTKHGMMALVSAVARVIRWDHETEITIHLPFEQPTYHKKLKDKLECTLKFSMSQYRIEFSVDALDLPLRTSDPELLQATESLVQKKLLMIEQKNLVLRVSRSLLELSPLIPPATSKMAGLMNISGRTFQRKLSELGLSYRELVNKIRHEKAIALIESSDTPLSTVAYELGFGDLSSFSRAFKSWTGMSPRQYRNTQASGV
ncbi:AraC family transcriptional regulator [Endozoicomonas sp. SESOKO4]|uniref:AraC family transcriptional regulator n=1 Tax=Endozoicomonas sp. SESOKO4 TaxID=2828745 RepID=UPI0021479934|nr:AraC family transcriptional regulator [Endozoicomonas sp. SESOKO4]